MKESLTIYSNLSVPSSVESGAYATKTDLTLKSWSKLNMVAQIINNPLPPIKGRTVVVYYAFSDFDLNVGSAPTILDTSKQAFSLTLDGEANSTKVYNFSQPADVIGDYLYTWVSHGSLGNPVTLTVNVVEVSSGGSGVSTGSGFSVSTEIQYSVTASSSAQTIANAHASRLSFSVYNDADKILFLKFGSGPTTSSYKVQVPSMGFYELAEPVYTGVITGLWESGATGSARVSTGGLVEPFAPEAPLSLATPAPVLNGDTGYNQIAWDTTHPVGYDTIRIEKRHPSNPDFTVFGDFSAVSAFAEVDTDSWYRARFTNGALFTAYSNIIGGGDLR